MSAAWVCECGHYNTGFADACYGGCGKDRPGEVRSAAANSRRPISGEEQDALEASVLFGGAPSNYAYQIGCQLRGHLGALEEPYDFRDKARLHGC